MLFLNGGHAFKQRRDGVEALFPGLLGEGGVHIGPLIMLTGSGIHQIFHGVRHGAALQELEPELGVLFFVVGSLLEESRNLLIAVLFGAGGVVGVLVPGFRFPGERRHQIFFGLAAFEFH